MPKRAGFWAYLKKAFSNQWNLLAVGAGVVAGAISGHPDVVVPLVAAGEMAYLAGLASHPRFQAYVDAQEHKSQRQVARETVTKPTLGKIFNALDPASKARFEQLRRRCRNLRTLAEGIRPDGGIQSIDSVQMESINKLLWVFLKLLYSRHSLKKFLDTTDEDQILSAVENLEKRIQKLGSAEQDDDNRARIRRTLTDTLASAQLRLDNYKKAQSNFEFVELELDRIDSKITSIAELSVNRQDPDFITSEVDTVASTMETTEAAINDLHFLELGHSDAPPPSFLDEKLEVN